MDFGICFGNYFDYENDSVAIQREYDLTEGLNDPWIDKLFPPDIRSLYYDTLNVPKGSLSSENIRWKRICTGEVVGCDEPQIYFENIQSSYIESGALGDNYFIDSIRLISSRPNLLKRLIVSTNNSKYGIYTFKFYKNGSWRYVHIDDAIPCRESGKVHYCRNYNRNETFSMLIEKAWAKLHGCYESIIHGCQSSTLSDLSAGADVNCIRSEVYRGISSIFDHVWETLQIGIQDSALMGCGRYLSDPYSDNSVNRDGISIGHIYQIVDAVVVSAEASQDYDALTLGMVCVRNLQARGGKFRGRWSFGHELWGQYEQIGKALLFRTRQLQAMRGERVEVSDGDDSLSLEEAQSLSLVLGEMYPERGIIFKKLPSQPVAPDLHWMAIEDFVEIFNRIYVVTDLSGHERYISKRYISRWNPGDFLCGSGGPPLLFPGPPTQPASIRREEPFQILPEGHVSLSSLPSHAPPSSPPPENESPINPAFTDNPMYPFSVNEHATLCITLYQTDRRWSFQRFDASLPPAPSPPTPERRLLTCVQYPLAIGFLIVRLFKTKIRLTDFKLRKTAGSSHWISFSASSTGLVSLSPGRYAVIPYTHTPVTLGPPLEYTLHFQFLKGQIDFEAEDLERQRLMDDIPSDDEDEDGSLGPTPRTMGEEEERLREEEIVEPWEYTEEINGIGVQTIYDEIGELTRYIGDLRSQALQLQGSFDLLTSFLQTCPDPSILINIATEGGLKHTSVDSEARPKSPINASDDTPKPPPDSPTRRMSSPISRDGRKSSKVRNSLVEQETVDSPIRKPNSFRK